MKKSISIILLGIALAAFLSSCKKYEDGPTFSLASKEGRVANQWKLVECKGTTDDGTVTDYTPTAKHIYGNVEFTREGNSTFAYADGDVWGEGTWDFDDKKESIVLTFSGASEVWTWKITKLKQKELWVKDESNPGEVVIYKFEE